MTEMNDKFFKDFFAENKQEIPDNGFSKRVMYHLPDHNKRKYHILTAIALIVCFLLFIFLGGFTAVESTIREVIVNMVNRESTFTLDLKSTIIATIVLLIMATKKLASLA